AIWLYEDDSPTPRLVYGKNANGQVITNDTVISFVKTEPATHRYYLTACIDVNFGTYPDNSTFPVLSGVCTDSDMVEVMVVNDVLPDFQAVAGRVDSLIDGALRGWACVKDHFESIAVHIYIDGPAGQGTLVGSVTANLRAGQFVVDQCRTEGVNHRFEYQPSEAELEQYNGRTLYVHAINPFGDNTLVGSMPVRLDSYSLVGNVDAIVDNQLQGWACAKDYEHAVSYRVFVGGIEGVGELIGESVANMDSAPEDLTGICRTVSNAHNFSFAFTEEVQLAHAGKDIFVQGVNALGATVYLSGSGALQVPGTVLGSIASPVLSADLTENDDCYHRVFLNAPADVPADYRYELYQRYQWDAVWPITPTARYSLADGDVPPFHYVFNDPDGGGLLDYRARICLSTGDCSAYSETLSLEAHCLGSVMPVVELRPAAGAVYALGGEVHLQASATSENGTIVSMEFWQGGTLLYTATEEPYSYDWLPEAAGDYEILAVAQDEIGHIGDSGYQTITVSAMPLPVPVLSVGLFDDPANPDLIGENRYAIGMGAEEGVPYNFEYRLYEKLAEDAQWPVAPVGILSAGNDDAPPFYHYIDNKPDGNYQYRSLVCLAGSAECGDFSVVLEVAVTQNSAPITDAPENPTVVGNVDSLIDGNLRGWVCVRDYAESIGIHVYVDGAAGQGTLVGSTIANYPSGQSIVDQCRTGGVNHRFDLLLNDAQLEQYDGSTLHVHAINPFGDNTQVGTILVRLDSYTVEGRVEAIVDNHLLGWACAKDFEYAVNYRVFVDGVEGVGELIGEGVANEDSAPEDFREVCRTVGNAHSFSFALTEEILLAHVGKDIFVQAVNPLGSIEYLSGSGALPVSATGLPVVLSAGLFDDPVNPVLVGENHYAIGFNVPIDVRPNFEYELYEKGIDDLTWPLLPLAVFSVGNNDTPPFYHFIENKPEGVYQYRAQVCLAGTLDCSEFFPVINVAVGAELDSDQDGLADVWEIQNVGDLSQDGDGDFNGDGVSNLEEFLIYAEGISNEVMDNPVAPVMQSDTIVTMEERVETDKVNTIGGSFRVDESGAATYTIPIAMSAGTAGVVPELALSYASLAGNGLLGKGWSLAGQKSVNRCRQTLYQDQNPMPITWGSDDRFCLNGARLVLVSGEYGAAESSYRTEIDSQVVVKAIGGALGHPDYFEVKAKDGSTSIYGGVGQHDSEKSAYKDDLWQQDRIVGWAISEFSDSVENKIVYHYSQDKDNHLLDSIDYGFGLGATPSASVNFEYENRHDLTSSYVAGYKFTLTKRLAAINVNNNNMLVRQYKLNYRITDVVTRQQSRMYRIDMCIDGGVCHSSDISTNFSWGTPHERATAGTPAKLEHSNNVYFKFNTFHSHTSGGDATSRSHLNGVSPIDINGDGKPEFVTISTKLNESGEGPYEHTLRARGIIVNFTTKFYNHKEKIQVIDYNGDGRQDLVFKHRLYVSEPTGSGLWELSPGAPSGEPIPTGTDPIFTDVNGDGLSDMLTVDNGSVFVRFLERNPAEPVTSSRYYHYGASVQFPIVDADGIQGIDSTWLYNASNITTGDFNGDGQMDLLVNVREHVIGASQGGHISQCVDDPTNNTFPPMASCLESYRDFVVQLTKQGNSFLFERTLLAQNDANERSEESTSIEGWIENRDDKHSLRTVDVNSDGLPDLVYFYYRGNGTTFDNLINLSRQQAGGSWAFRINNGAGFEDEQIFKTFEITEPNDTNPSWVDLDLDGVLDVIWHSRLTIDTGELHYQSWQPGTENFGPENLLAATTANFNQSYSFFDVNSDGWLDVMSFDGESGSLRVHLGAQGEIKHRPDLIHSITNGLGAKTTINYQPLIRSGRYKSIEAGYTASTGEQCDETTISYPDGSSVPGTPYCYPTSSLTTSDFYRAINDPFYDLPEDVVRFDTAVAPVLEAALPALVVTDVFSNAPTAENPDEQSGISYFYHQLRLQAGGRGSLGYKKITSLDLQTAVST
ncbi:MAG: hypothetical protein COA42_24255, partial [Alteromonadaceae bacterium]